ncbi:MAG: hypothetical protein H6868_02925 [Rhodospirillales bacterium]|nr:hypothetical protein [Rhodospirillales bacterium]
MTIQSIYGLGPDQMIEPQYLDCKQLNDTAALWRMRVRGKIVDLRILNEQLARSRDLNERYALVMERASVRQQFETCRRLYRKAHHEALHICRRYIGGLNPETRSKEIMKKAA